MVLGEVGCFSMNEVPLLSGESTQLRLSQSLAMNPASLGPWASQTCGWHGHGQHGIADVQDNPPTIVNPPFKTNDILAKSLFGCGDADPDAY